MRNTIDLDQKFFFGGKAVFTVESDATGLWKTFKLRKPKFETHEFALFSLVGPDNENSYAYVGMVNPANGSLRFTKASKRNDNSPDVIVFKWLMKGVFGDMTLGGGKVHHEGKCGCCGRTLTVPESIKRGIGPECWAKMGGL